MPEYPLSSKLLALLSGSFYGTAGTRQERKARRRVEARRDEKDEKELEKVENERRNETQKRGRWSTKMAEGQDKPLCPRGPRGNVVSVSYFANPAIIFYTAPIPLPPPLPLVTPGLASRARESLIFCYLTFRTLDFLRPVFSGHGSSSTLRDLTDHSLIQWTYNWRISIFFFA